METNKICYSFNSIDRTAKKIYSLITKLYKNSFYSYHKVLDSVEFQVFKKVMEPAIKEYNNIY